MHQKISSPPGKQSYQTHSPSNSSYKISMLTIRISSSGFSLYTLVFSIWWMTSKPCTARPKIVCLRSNQVVFSVVMKNWEPLVLGPALAMLTVYGLSCLSVENSSSNSRPQILSPPVPSPRGSPHYETA